MLQRIWCIKCPGACSTSEAPVALKHQSRGRRALILMTQTQHPCCSCSLTPLYTQRRAHIYKYICIYCLLDKSVSFPPSHLLPLLSFTHFFPPVSSPLPSLLSSSPVPLTTTAVMIHVMNHRQIFEGFSPHLFPSSPFFFTQSPATYLSLILLFFPFSVSVCGTQDLSLLNIREPNYESEC